MQIIDVIPEFVLYVVLILLVLEKTIFALTPSPSPAGEGNKKKILLLFSCGRRGWGVCQVINA